MTELDTATLPPQERQDHVCIYIPELMRRLDVHGQPARVWVEHDVYPGYLHILCIDAPVPPGRTTAVGGYCEMRMLTDDRSTIDDHDVPKPVDKWQELLEAADDVLNDYGAKTVTPRGLGNSALSPSIRRLYMAVEEIDPSRSPST